MDLFDDIERLMFNHVVEMYFASFKESPLWSKLFQFLYMTETSVVEDDFTLFRGENCSDGCRLLNFIIMRSFMFYCESVHF